MLLARLLGKFVQSLPTLAAEASSHVKEELGAEVRNRRF